MTTTRNEWLSVFVDGDDKPSLQATVTTTNVTREQSRRSSLSSFEMVQSMEDPADPMGPKPSSPLDVVSLSDDWEKCRPASLDEGLEDEVDLNETSSSYMSVVTAPTTEGSWSLQRGEYNAANSRLTLSFPLQLGVIDRSDILWNWLNQVQTVEFLESASVAFGSSGIPSNTNTGNIFVKPSSPTCQRSASASLSETNLVIRQLDGLEKTPNLSPISRSNSLSAHDYCSAFFTAGSKTSLVSAKPSRHPAVVAKLESYVASTDRTNSSVSTSLLGQIVGVLFKTALSLKVAPILSSGTWPWDVGISDDQSLYGEWDDGDLELDEGVLFDMPFEHEILAH